MDEVQIVQVLQHDSWPPPSVLSHAVSPTGKTPWVWNPTPLRIACIVLTTARMLRWTSLAPPRRHDVTHSYMKGCHGRLTVLMKQT